MTNEEKRKTADIVEAFGYINQDIRGAHNRLTELLKQKKDFQEWKKYELGRRNTKDNYYDDEGFCSGDSLWYYLNTYGIYKNKVIGFTFIMSVEYDEEDDKEYKEFIETLDKNLNKNAPMLLIYGIYEPIEKDAKYFYVFDENQFNIVDSVIRISEDWENYDPKELEYSKPLDVQIDYMENNEVAEGYEKWYKNAVVKIEQIQNITSPEKAEEIIDDLIEMTDEYIKESAK